MRRSGFVVLCVLLAGLAIGTTALAAGDDVNSHLVGWWKLSETTGTAAADSSAKPHNGVLEGGGTFDANSAPRQAGKAISLDGKDQCVKITGYKGITGTQPRTVMAWIKTKTPGGELVSWGLNDAGKMFIFGFVRNRVGTTPKGGYLYMKAPINDDAWHHVAVVVREASPPNLHDDVKLYRDGELAEIDDIGMLDLWPIDTGDKQDVTIGRRFKGAIGDVRIYDCPLNEDQIKAIYGVEAKAAK